MTMTVAGPGGVSVDFPDGTDHGTIDKVMRQATGMGDAPSTSAGPNRFDQMFGTQGQDLPTAGQPSPDAPPSQSWGDVAKSAVGNVLPSAGRFVGDIAQAVTHPVATVQGLGNVAAGVGEKGIRALTGGDPGSHEQYANAVGKMIVDRYGSIDALKQTLATDPVGAAADLASILTGGEGLVAKVPALSKAAEVAGTVGRAIDPINNAVKAVSAVGKGAGAVASEALGISTGAGGKAIRTAAQAGHEGGDASRAFTDNMRGAVPMEDVIGDAKGALQNIKNERQAAYKAGMGDLSKDSTVLDFNKIDKAWDTTKGVGSYQGPTSGISMSLSPSTAATVKEVDDVLNKWRSLPPADFHTATGLDALKQRLGDIVDDAKPGTAAEKVATRARNIVKDQITAQAPEYAKTMAGYANASDLIKQMEKTLSQNRTASVDTQLRKLQSVMRNGVDTNYGARAKLVNVLQQSGAANIMQKLAGQSLSAFAPRGLVARVLGGADLASLGQMILNPAAAIIHAPAAVAGLAAASPRLVGEAAHLVGKVARPIAEAANVASKGAQAAFQAGRLQRTANQ